MKQENQSKMAELFRQMVETIAEKKANANCFGFMYEPEKPEILMREKSK